jgi:hypothetical protein
VFPLIASFTTTILFPYTLCNRRESTSGQVSLPLRVLFTPSVMESPNAQTTAVSGSASTSMASNKNQDVVVKGNAASFLSRVWSPLAGAVK